MTGGAGTSFALTKGSLVIASLDPDEAAEAEARLWANTEEDPDTACLFSTLKPSGKGCGYPYISIKGVQVGAHVAAYVFTHGPILDGLQVRHGPTCDGHPDQKGRLCVNPEHLAVGTNADNVADRNGGWWAREWDDIPLSAGVRDTYKAFDARFGVAVDGPDIYPATAPA